MSAITAKASRKMKKYAVLTREPRCFLGSFDFSWEQRKVSELFRVTRGYVLAATQTETEKTDEKPYPVYSSQTKDKGLMGYYKNYLYEDAITWTTDGANAGTVNYRAGKFYCTNVCGVLLSNEVKANQMIAEALNNVAKGYVSYVGNPKLMNNVMADIVIQIPTHAEEREQLSSFFANLDHLITLHQRKCVFLFGFFQAFISMIFTASTFSWEQRKLGELVDRVVRKNTNNESTLPLTISAQYGLVDQITYFNNRVASRDVSNYYLVLNGEFAYNKSTSDGYPFGAVKRLDLYEKGVLSTLYIVFTPKKEQQIDSDFLTVFFDTDRWHKGVAERAAEGARNHGLLNISAEDFFDIDLSVPKDIVEQKQIGAFIRQLDNLITLHQRECISFTARAGRLILTANKKRNTSSWEQRKFSDITFPAGEKNKDNLPLESYSITNEHGFVPQDEKFENGGTMREADKRMYYIVSPNSFAYNPARINVGSIGYQNIGKNVIVSSLYEVFKTSEDVDDRLLWHWFKSSDFQKLIMQLQEGGVRLYFYYDKLCMGEVSLPSLDEQRKIGKLFDTLDNLITLHQRKPFLMKWRTSDANRNQTNRLVL